MLEGVQYFCTMRHDISIEDGCSDFAKGFAQVFVAAVGDGNAGRHLNEELMDNQSVRAKRDQFVLGQAAVLAQFMCLVDAA